MSRNEKMRLLCEIFETLIYYERKTKNNYSREQAMTNNCVNSENCSKLPPYRPRKK